METNQYVLALLKSYHRMKQEINILQYELEHFKNESKEEIIAAMNFTSGNSEHIQSDAVSDKTPSIALKYRECTSRDNDHAFQGLTERLNIYRGIVDRLEHYVEKLEVRQILVIRKYYFERVGWRDLQILTGLSTKTLMKYRRKAICLLAKRYDTLLEMNVISQSDLVLPP